MNELPYGKLVDRLEGENAHLKSRVAELERWIDRSIRPHVNDECDGITSTDCLDTIREDLAALDAGRSTPSVSTEKDKEEP